MTKRRKKPTRKNVMEQAQATRALLARVKELMLTGKRSVRIYKLDRPSKDEISETLFGAYQMEYESHAVEPLPMANIAEVRKNCDAIASWLTRKDAKPSLAIIGSVGTGKTTMLRAIQYFLQAVRINIKFICARDLPTLVGKDDDALEELIKPENGFDFLLIDDVGEEPGEYSKYGNKISLFSRIIEGRYDYRLPTIITSNLAFMDKEQEHSFKNAYGERVHERMVETFNVRLMTGDSYREKIAE